MPDAHRAWIGVAVLAVCGCSHPVHSTTARPSAAVKAPAPARSSSSSPSRPASAPPTIAPPTIAPTAAPTASPAATASPSASPTPKNLSAALPTPKRVPRVAPNAAPQILDVGLSETDVHPGDRVFGRVVTTSNVASVEARIGGYSVSLAKVGVGRFELTYTVGPLPWFVRGNFAMEVIARNTRGDMATRTVPLTVR